MGNATVLQFGMEIGGVKGALAWFRDHDLAGPWLKTWNEVIARLALDENSPHRPDIADLQCSSSAAALRGRTIRKVGTVALLGVHDRPTAFPEGPQELFHGRYCGRQAPHIVAQDGAESAGFEKIALHVDDQERGIPQI